MKIELLHCTPLYIAVQAARECYDSMDKSDAFLGCCWGSARKCEDCDCGDSVSGECTSSEMILGENDIQLLKNLIKSGHESPLEQISFNFRIQGVSRALLQQLVRHRIASPSVQSSRYTLKKLLRNNNIEDFIVKTGNARVDDLIFDTMLQIQEIAQETDIPNDVLKYALPEAYKTSLVYAINARSLRNLLELRSGKKALWEIREFAKEIYKQVPLEYYILFEDVMAWD